MSGQVNAVKRLGFHRKATAGLPVHVGVSLYDVSLQMLNKVFVVARAVKLRRAVVIDRCVLLRAKVKQMSNRTSKDQALERIVYVSWILIGCVYIMQPVFASFVKTMR